MKAPCPSFGTQRLNKRYARRDASSYNDRIRLNTRAGQQRHAHSRDILLSPDNEFRCAVYFLGLAM